ncbi:MULTISPECIES: hypothetical protein [Priestia]|uniref:hypothetical protein n=1 Tax=Priestia TaxID=2800373 RepID=UPI000532DC33|nr:MULTISPECIES: hypothetical protein [Priestia]
MLETFIKQTITLLKESDIRFQRTKIIPVTFTHETGVKQVTLHMQSTLGPSSPRLSDNLVLQVMMMFTLLDAVIDSKYPNLEGKSFRYRYSKLPFTNDEDLIFKETYRLMKMFRNASVHSMSAINFTEESVMINYEFKNTVFKLEVTKLGVELLFTYILEVFELQNDLTDNHILSLRRSLYDELISQIKSFSDDFQKPLQSIPANRLRLKRSIRYCVENPTYMMNNKGDIEITSPYSADLPNRGVDYLVELKDKKALIPEEILKDNQFTDNDFNNWLLVN